MNTLKRTLTGWFDDKETAHEIAVIERYKRILDMQLRRYQNDTLKLIQKNINEGIQNMKHDFVIDEFYKGYKVTRIPLSKKYTYNFLITNLKTNEVVCELKEELDLIGRQKANIFIDGIVKAMELMQAK